MFVRQVAITASVQYTCRDSTNTYFEVTYKMCLLTNCSLHTIAAVSPSAFGADMGNVHVFGQHNSLFVLIKSNVIGLWNRSHIRKAHTSQQVCCTHVNMYLHILCKHPYQHTYVHTWKQALWFIAPCSLFL